MMYATLGVDTSCYTTSAALVCGGRILSSARRLLKVDEGQRGLRQSDGVYQHTLALPSVMEEAMSGAPEGVVIDAVCASCRPRDQEDSYMPVFLVGASFARTAAALLRAPFIETSHQMGHVRAAMYGTELSEDAFLALHLSGGTTETLLVENNLRITPIGGTSDLNAGQLVDRVGVKLHLPFPAGPYLEELARKGEAKARFPLSHTPGECSFSGAEAQAMRLIDSGALSDADVAAEVYSYLSRAVARLIADAAQKSHAKSALLAGGVASSALLRSLLPSRLEKLKCDVKIYWARPELSGDNACGVALIGDEKRKGE